MDFVWTITLSIILIVIIVFGSMRQNRIVRLLNGENLMDGGAQPKSPSPPRSPSPQHPFPQHGEPNKPLSHSGPRYVGRPHNRYYGDPSLGSYGPQWSTWNYWWPSYIDCTDYATQQCVGSSDYQSCFNDNYNYCNQ